MRAGPTDKLSMIMAVKEDCGKIGGPQECAGCGKKIHDKYLLKVQSFVINLILWLAGSLAAPDSRVMILSSSMQC